MDNVILYIEDVDLNNSNSLLTSFFVVILYIEDVDLNGTIKRIRPQK